MFKKKLLIVDDDKFICSMLEQSMKDVFDVVTTDDVDIAFKIATQNNVDALLLDVNLGAESGIELCEKLRKNQLTQKIPIMIMTGFGDKNKLVSSYKVGADDYIEKPIETDELSARLTARLKRVEDIAGKINTFGNLKIYSDRNEVELNGTVRQFSQIEFTLLKVFLMNVNKKVSREEILNSVWVGTKVEQRTVDVHISSLRKKLKEFNHQIDSLYGSGYILRPMN
ncbi:MAG: response regulator transcription factor [Pseudobdellovibrio sp.]